MMLRRRFVSPLRCVLPLVCGVLLGRAALGPANAADDEDDKPGATSDLPSLTREQQRAVGIVVAHPLDAKTPRRVEALGIVLDPTVLISEMDDATAAATAAQSASAELGRLRELYRGGAGASIKMIDAAKTDDSKAQAESRAAAARFLLHWAPVAALPPPARHSLVQASMSGRSLLVRADLPGGHGIGELPDRALLNVDGIEVPGRILGALRTVHEMQTAGLLIEVRAAPAGLGPGAHVPVALLSTEQRGLLVPRGALLYDQNGAYVYKQLHPRTGERTLHYAPVTVTLLAPFGEGWLVKGVDDDDDIVVQGAGVLWSLQGMGARAADDDD